MNKKIRKFIERQEYKRLEYIENITFKRLRDLNKSKDPTLKDIFALMH